MPDSFDDLPLFSSSRHGARDILQDSTQVHPSSSLNAVINAWGEALEDAGSSPHTVKAFTGDLSILAEYMGAGQAINQIGTHDIRNFLDWMLNRRGVPCSPKTYSRRITSIKAFFRWLVDENVLSENPADPIPQQTVISPLPTVLEPAEVTAVLRAARKMRRGKDPDARPFTLVSLLLETGIKKGECLDIHLNHIDLESPDGPILFVRYGDVTKRYKERKLQLSEEWVEAFKEYREQYELTDQLFPWSPRRLEYLLEDIAEAAELEKRLSFDTCRWTCSLMDYKAGMEGDKIRQKLGISKIQWREVGNKLDRLAAQEEGATSA
jgi:integrase/recombinase XerD